MKKQILAGAVVALLVLMAMPVVAQQNGQTLNIGGIVPLQLILGLAPDARAQDLELVGTTIDFDQIVAGLTITTNNTAGWELLVYSVNGSDLLNAAGDNIPYTIRFTGSGGGATAAIPSGIASDLSGLLIGSADETDHPANLGDLGNLIIQYDKSESHRAGYYADQLAVVLRAQ